MKNYVDRDTLVSRIDHQTSVQVGAREVILDTEDGVYYGLNPAGRELWELLQTRISVKQISNFLFERYDADPEQCETIAITFIEQLLTYGLVTIQNTQSPEQFP